MNTSRDYSLQRQKFAVFILFMFSFTLLPKSGTDGNSVSGEMSSSSKMVVGSRPPGCVNKCLNCRPCVATLVVPVHQDKGSKASSSDEDSYYLLSWKCACGNKLYQP